MPTKQENRKTITAEDAEYMRGKITDWGRIPDLSAKSGIGQTTLYKLTSADYAYCPKADTLAKILVHILPESEIPAAIERFQPYFRSQNLSNYVNKASVTGAVINSALHQPNTSTDMINCFRWWAKDYDFQIYTPKDEDFQNLMDNESIQEPIRPDMIINASERLFAVYASAANDETGFVRRIAGYDRLKKWKCFEAVLFYLPKGAAQAMVKGYSDVEIYHLPDILARLQRPPRPKQTRIAGRKVFLGK